MDYTVMGYQLIFLIEKVIDYWIQHPLQYLMLIASYLFAFSLDHVLLLDTQ